MNSSPTKRSLALLRKEGYTACVTEKWNPHAKVRQDAFGFIDILGIRPFVDEDGEPVYPLGILAVQTTTVSNQAARVKKIAETPAAALWLAQGGRIEVHGWKKYGERWKCTRQTITAVNGGVGIDLKEAST